VRRRSVRLLAVVLALGAPAALAGCGGSGGATIDLRAAGTPTTFLTLPPPSSTTTPPTTEPGQRPTSSRSTTTTEAPDEIDPATGNIVYEVGNNDYLLKIAERFGTTPEAIAEANGWSSIQHSIFPGDRIQVPAAPDASEPPTGTDGEQSGGDCADGSAPDTYTIKRGDIPARVAAQFDVTVDDLAAANADTPGYRNFVVGTEIVIPC